MISNQEKKELLKSLGANDKVCDELLEYTQNQFNVDGYEEKELEDEPFIETWREISKRSKQEPIVEVMNDAIPHSDRPINLNHPELVNIEIYNSIAGNIPVIYAKDEQDFYEIIRQIVYKGREVKNLEQTGASFAYGRNNKFIVLSNKPYSNIQAQSIGLEEEQWKSFSVIIRREHESTHYFTKRCLGSSRNNIHDELVADFSGFMCAVGEFKAKWFLMGMGIDKYPEKQADGRFPVYTSTLSDEAKDILKKITVDLAYKVENWSKLEKTKMMSRTQRALFLCKYSILDLYLILD